MHTAKHRTQLHWLFLTAVPLVAGLILLAIIFHAGQARPWFLDELVYAGQYLPPLLNPAAGWPLSVDAKQPLYFWMLKFVHSALPNKWHAMPFYLGTLARSLNFLYLIASWALVCWGIHPLAGLLLLGSPFIVVHAQMVMIENLLLLGTTLVFVGAVKKLRSLMLLGLFALLLTKTSALILGGALCLTAFLWLFLDSKSHLASNLAHLAAVTILSIGGGLLVFFSAQASVEASNFFSLSRFSFQRFIEVCSQVGKNWIYFVSAGATLSLLWGLKFALLSAGSARKKLREFGRSPAFLCAATIVLGLVVALGIYRDLPRYYFFIFLPLLFLSFLPLRTLKQRQSPYLMVVASVLLVVDGTLNALHFSRFESKWSRISDEDRTQYFVTYAVKLPTKPWVKEVLATDTLVYGLPPPLCVRDVALSFARSDPDRQDFSSSPSGKSRHLQADSLPHRLEAVLSG